MKNNPNKKQKLEDACLDQITGGANDMKPLQTNEIDIQMSSREGTLQGDRLREERERGIRY